MLRATEQQECIVRGIKLMCKNVSIWEHNTFWIFWRREAQFVFICIHESFHISA